VNGIAIEAATGHVEVAVFGDDEDPLALEVEEVGHGHTRRVAPLVGVALERAGVGARDLGWVAASLGPGSFTGARVGLATAEALALASGAERLGASTLASLALSAPVRRALVIPLVPAGRRDVYAGYFRTDAHGATTLLAAPRVTPADGVLIDTDELLQALGAGVRPRFVGPGAARERDTLERAFPGSTEPAWRHEGPSALDLARAARSGRGPAAGLPAAGATLTPLYVRSAQAEEVVRRRVVAAIPTVIRPMTDADLPGVTALERAIFSDPWSESFFRSELRQPLVHARIAERDGAVAGYSMAWLGHGVGHLGNLATAPAHRRRGVARALIDELLVRAAELEVRAITLEVRVANAEAQALYRGYGFRVAGVRRGYYRDTGEDALILEWRPRAPAPTAASH
jgi:ribosomal-protein-alanine N-acetyltransferase